MLIIQLAILIVSLEEFPEFSPFCTVALSGGTAEFIGLIHFYFLLMAAIGFASLKWKSVRPFYLAMILIGLAVLPIQAGLVGSGELTCDVF